MGNDLYKKNKRTQLFFDKANEVLGYSITNNHVWWYWWGTEADQDDSACGILALSDYCTVYVWLSARYGGRSFSWWFYPITAAIIIVTNNLFIILFTNSILVYIILESICRNSMNIYLSHWILFVLVSFIIKSLLHIESAAIQFYCFLAASIIFFIRYWLFI